MDERDGRDRLREIPDQPPGDRGVFLGEQPEVLRQGQQAVEQPVRVVDSAEQREVVDEPEAAREEGAFAGRQAVVVFGRVIAQHEAVVHQAVLDRGDRAGS